MSDDASRRGQLTHQPSRGRDVSTPGASPGRSSVTIERARTQWLFGDWSRLDAVDLREIEGHEERATLALYIASARFQKSRFIEGRHALRVALEWGCERKDAIRVLAAGAFNSLGRAAAVSGRATRAYELFKSSVELGAPESDLELVTQARITQQCWQIGLESPQQDAMQILKRRTDAHQGAPLQLKVSPPEEATAFNKRAYAYYKNISRSVREQERAPFIHLESKSIPRAGLHYLKKSFQKFLGNRFTFCEYYQEPGCCKQMPCTYTAYSGHLRGASEPGMRLIKSHDFEMADPVYPVFEMARRIILVRHPLFVLTSWYALDSLAMHSEALEKAGIDMRKIWYLHEPSVVDAAYQVLDNNFMPQRSDQLAEWLQAKVVYLRQFAEKWVVPILDNPQQYQKVVRYEQIDEYVASILLEFEESLPKETAQVLKSSKTDGLGSFKARKDPFKAKSERLTEFMREHSEMFRESNSAVLEDDVTKVLAGDVS